jgi:hypothetical protein
MVLWLCHQLNGFAKQIDHCLRPTVAAVRIQEFDLDSGEG